MEIKNIDYKLYLDLLLLFHEIDYKLIEDYKKKLNIDDITQLITYSKNLNSDEKNKYLELLYDLLMPDLDKITNYIGKIKEIQKLIKY